MRAQPILDIMTRLETLDVDDHARNAFRRLVIEVGAQHGVRDVERSEQLAYIRRLFALRVSRPTIRDRITVRYSISPRQAYRVISEAMKLRHEPRKFGTNDAQDIANESITGALES